MPLWRRAVDETPPGAINKRSQKVIYLREFEKWRAAPSIRRPAVARCQVATYSAAALIPASPSDPNRILSMLADSDGKTFAHCTSDELEAWLTWFRALRQAARQLDACMTLGIGGCKL